MDELEALEAAFTGLDGAPGLPLPPPPADYHTWRSGAGPHADMPRPRWILLLNISSCTVYTVLYRLYLLYRLSCTVYTVYSHVPAEQSAAATEVCIIADHICVVCWSDTVGLL